MSIERLQAFYGFTTMPFRRDLAPGMLHRHTGHAEAVARIGWCVAERALGVVTGEVGAGKTVAVRAALAGLDPSRHTVIYLGNPAVGARGLYTGIVSALGGIPRFHKAALIPQTADALAAEEHERGRTVVLISHRVSTVRGADFIVVLERGRVVEQGTHAELVDRGGYYAELSQKQMLEEELESI